MFCFVSKSPKNGTLKEEQEDDEAIRHILQNLIKEEDEGEGGAASSVAASSAEEAVRGRDEGEIVGLGLPLHKRVKLEDDDF